MDVDKLKGSAVAEIDARRDELVELSLRIHSNPELAFEEVKASGWLAEYLERNGFQVERGVCELPTAFKATYGSGEPRVGLLAEYDALPKVGHACGHNIIGTAAVAAGVAVRGVVDEIGGSVAVVGTPAEESFGGKVMLAERGAFQDLDAAMLVHPYGLDMASMQALACIRLEVRFFGKATHAAGNPEGGINALEAVIQGFNGVNSLRQHISERARVHGIITHGGEAPNVVPDFSSATFLVRSEFDFYLEELKEKVLNCFKAAALATGARLEYEWASYYAPLRCNVALAELYSHNIKTLGRDILPPMERGLGSSDMGNVSVLVPSIHPMIAIATLDVVPHSLEFAEAAASENGHQGLVDGAKGMAMTVVDLIARPEEMKRVRDEFAASQDEGGRG
ncbi:MAG: M20 family metallopeptidase [Chloroflexota bacterium]|nr:M20 family metallopeptidase [Chloroflexota bacterium]